MPRIKELPKVDRPRERLLAKGCDALSKSDLLAILLGSGIKGKNVQKLAKQIISKFGKNFLNISVGDLLTISGIGKAKALQIVSAIALVKRFCEKGDTTEIINNSKDVLSLTYDLRNKKKEHLVCLYLNARNALIKKEIISVGVLNKSLLHPREIFHPAVELNSASIILVHNHPSGDPTPSGKDKAVIDRIIEAGEIMGISIIDFIITAKNGSFSFREILKRFDGDEDYVAEGVQLTLFDLLKEKEPSCGVTRMSRDSFFILKKVSADKEKFQIQNRRFLGNKYKLLGFIDDIVREKCNGLRSVCDIFAGTGVVGSHFNRADIKVISNDFLFSNYTFLKAFLGVSDINMGRVKDKIQLLNNLKGKEDNYFSINFGNSYFTLENARKIGAIRENIEKIVEDGEERAILLTSLLYATDKVANTVGHYDAFRKKLDSVQPLKLLFPDIPLENNTNNEVHRDDANSLIRNISCDLLYVDPPYNSRQYCDSYHLLENLVEWNKPLVHGKAKKMDRAHLKSEYCLKTAPKAFADLIQNAKCKHILISYNNTGESKVGRSNARIRDREIINILQDKGKVEIFERDYKAFTTGKSDGTGHTERIFYCEVG